MGHGTCRCRAAHSARRETQLTPPAAAGGDGGAKTKAACQTHCVKPPHKPGTPAGLIGKWRGIGIQHTYQCALTPLDAGRQPSLLLWGGSYPYSTAASKCTAQFVGAHRRYGEWDGEFNATAFNFKTPAGVTWVANVFTGAPPPQFPALACPTLPYTGLPAGSTAHRSPHITLRLQCTATACVASHSRSPLLRRRTAGRAALVWLGDGAAGGQDHPRCESRSLPQRTRFTSSLLGSSVWAVVILPQRILIELCGVDLRAERRPRRLPRRGGHRPARPAEGSLG